jgi:hypothetical protein
MKMKLDASMRRWWRKTWVSSTEYRQSKLTFGDSKLPTDKLIGMSRNDVRLIIQLLTGHAALNRHLAKMRKVPSAKCPKCSMEDETPQHYVERCASFEDERKEILGEGNSLRKIVQEKNLHTLLRFVHCTKRLQEWSE